MTLKVIDREIRFPEAEREPLASDAPIMSELASPGPLVAAKASTSPNEIPPAATARASNCGAR
jgi:hypothetical protein